MEQFGPAIAALAALILVAGPIAVAVTKVTDLVRNAGDRADSWPSWVWNVIPLVIGVAICVGWGINLIDAVISAIPAFAEGDGVSDLAGQVLTGFVIGGMAGFWHEKMDGWSQWAKANTAEVVEVLEAEDTTMGFTDTAVTGGAPTATPPKRRDER